MLCSAICTRHRHSINTHNLAAVKLLSCGHFALLFIFASFLLLSSFYSVLQFVAMHNNFAQYNYYIKTLVFRLDNTSLSLFKNTLNNIYTYCIIII